MTVPVLSKIGRILEDYLQGVQQNLLATFTLTLVIFISQLIEGSFGGISYRPMNFPIREGAAILLGLPLYVEITLRAVKSENRWVKKFINGNRAVVGVIVIPFIVFLGKVYPWQFKDLSALTFYFIISYMVTGFTYATYILFQEILRDFKENEDLDFMDRLLFASLPSAMAVVIVLMILSFTARLLIENQVVAFI